MWYMVKPQNELPDMLVDVIAVVADVMTTQLQIMLADVISMVVDVMTTQGCVCYLADVKANCG